MELGLVEIYTGDGKGKTTASIGLAIRMLGNGNKVAFIQFMKGMPSGEVELLSKLGAKTMRTPSVQKFFYTMTDEEKEICKKENEACLNFAKECMQGDYDLVVMDEIMSTMMLKVVDEDKVIDMIKNKNKTCEVVLTGRDPSDKIKEIADYITEMKKIKHPYDKGINARKGIEY